MVVKARPLPENRNIVEDPEYGYLEPVSIPQGKCSVRQALEFISNNQMNSKKFSPEVIAESYKLDKRQVQSVIKYFHTMEVQFPMSEGGTLPGDDVEAKRISAKRLITMLKSGSIATKGGSSDSSTSGVKDYK